MTVDALVIAARNRLPGQDPAGWASEIHALGQAFARTVLAVRMGNDETGDLTREDLVWAGMAEELAEALIPDLPQDAQYIELYKPSPHPTSWPRCPKPT